MARPHWTSAIPESVKGVGRIFSHEYNQLVLTAFVTYDMVFPFALHFVEFADVLASLLFFFLRLHAHATDIYEEEISRPWRAAIKEPAWPLHMIVPWPSCPHHADYDDLYSKEQLTAKPPALTSSSRALHPDSSSRTLRALGHPPGRA